MDTSEKYRLSVKNFRAIERADVVLDGITVVAGINACGKSTLSKLFYEIFDVSNRFEEIAYRSFFEKYETILDELLRPLFFMLRESKDGLFMFRRTGGSDVGKRKERIERTLERARETLKTVRLKENFDKFANAFSDWGERIFRLFSKNELSVPDGSRFQEIGEVSSILKNALNIYQENFQREYDQIEASINARDFSIFQKELTDEFGDAFADGSEINLLDDIGLITDKTNGFLKSTFDVESVYYYDTPFCVSSEFRATKKYYARLRNVLKNARLKPEKKEIVQEINRDFAAILRGQVLLEESRFLSDDFWYRREDGECFRLNDCATGIKSLGILQMLLNRGALTDRTVVIVDEPEAHLHPAWIVEYARLTIMINKRLGTRFFIATHNPDMASAIRNISEKEGTLESTRFYIAEQAKNPFQFIFAETDAKEKSIEPLFDSFVLALDKISEYSRLDGEESDDD